MTETWRPIPGWEGFYEASDLGRIRSLDRTVPRSDGKPYRHRGRVLTPHESSVGYLQVALRRPGAQMSTTVHRLVLAAFRGERPDMVACHADGTRTNNALANLRWGTHSDNAYDAVAHGTHNSASKTHCKHGHPFTPDNTYIIPSRGARECETCREARRAAYVARKAAAA